MSRWSAWTSEHRSFRSKAQWPSSRQGPFGPPLSSRSLLRFAELHLIVYRQFTYPPHLMIGLNGVLDSHRVLVECIPDHIQGLGSVRLDQVGHICKQSVLPQAELLFEWLQQLQDVLIRGCSPSLVVRPLHSQRQLLYLQCFSLLLMTYVWTTHSFLHFLHPHIEQLSVDVARIAGALPSARAGSVHDG